MSHPSIIKIYPLSLPVFLIAILFSSCSSIRNNYLGSAEREPVNFKITAQQFAQSDSSRQQTETITDSLIEALAKKHNRHLSAGEINLLFFSFGAHLNYDRTFNSLLQKGKRKREQLSEEQCYYATRLLLSAAYYEHSFQNKRKIRRMLNRGDDANTIPKNILQKSRNFLYAPSVRKKLLSSPKSAATDSLLKLLPATNFLKSAFFLIYRKNDRIVNALYNIFTLGGRKILGGNSGYPVAIRARHRKTASKIHSQIQPFDILLSKNSSYITSVLIPGYFGHAAIWLGADELHPKRKKLKNIILKNKIAHPRINEKGLAEAVRSGVQMNSLKEFTDGDVYLVLRLRPLTDEQKKSIASNTIKQLHKCYDFNFDIESPDMLNCTELVYLAYDFIEWKVSPFMGRYTIFPDDVLKTALNDERFEIVLLMKDGELILHPDTALLRRLIDY